MRMEEDVNENEEHFVHVGRGSLRSRAVGKSWHAQCVQGDLGGLARSAYKCVSLARLRSCTGVHSRRLASQSRISACNLASLDSAAVAARKT